MTKISEKAIKGFKAFNKDMTCKGFQFEEGKTFEMENDPVICQTGFHFCENPLDCIRYYDLTESEFAEVESMPNAKIDTHNEDSKIVTTKIKINSKIGLKGFVDASVKFLLEITKKSKSTNDKGNYGSQLASSGDGSQLASSGEGSKLASSGDRSKLASSGDRSKLELNGNNSVGTSIGINSMIKGKKGNWITLAEYDDNYKAEYDDNYKLVYVKSAQIDGKKIKEDTWYILKNERFTEVI